VNLKKTILLVAVCATIGCAHFKSLPKTMQREVLWKTAAMVAVGGSLAVCAAMNADEVFTIGVE
jgi:hypothetical protein